MEQMRAMAGPALPPRSASARGLRSWLRFRFRSRGGARSPSAAPAASRGLRRRKRKRSRRAPRRGRGHRGAPDYNSRGAPRRRVRPRAPARPAPQRPRAAAGAPVPEAALGMGGGTGGSRALLGAALLALPWAPSLAAVAAGGGPEGFGSHAVTATDDLLWRLGHATWARLEGWLGPEPLRLLAEGLAAMLWLISSAISAALAVLSAITGDILSACGLGGAWLVRGAALAPGEVQRVLLWGLAALAGARLLPRLLGLVLAPLRPALRWLKLCCFLGAFLRVAAAEGSSPTAQAAMLLGLWGLYVLLGGGGGHPPSPEVRLEAAIHSLEWKVEELCRRQRWGGPQNREEE